MTMLPPKLDAGGIAPPQLRQHAREIASATRQLVERENLRTDGNGPVWLLPGAQLGGLAVNGQPTFNATDALQDLYNEIASRGGGTVMAEPGYSYRFGPTTANPDGPICPPNVMLSGAYAPAGSRQDDASPSNFNYTTAPAFWIDSTARLNFYGGSWRDLMLIRTGFIDPTPAASAGNPFEVTAMRAALDIRDAYAGTAIYMDGGVTDGADDTRGEGLFAIGFDQMLDVENAARCSFRAMRGDNNSAIKLVNSGGMVRIYDVHCASFLTKNLRGVSAAASPIASTFQYGTRIAVTLGNTPSSTRLWTPFTSVSKNARRYYGANSYKSRSNNTTGNSAPVHTSGTVNDQGTAPAGYGVDWRYDGAYTGVSYAPSVWDTLLVAGDWVILGADPTWFGGDTMDPTTSPAQRGRVQIYQKHPSIAYTWVLDVAWDASLAADLVGKSFVVQPASRPGIFLYTENADNIDAQACGTKSSRIGYWCGGSAHVLRKCNFEPGAEGENDADDWGTISAYWGPDAADGRASQCAWKTPGTTIKFEVDDRNRVEFDGCEISNGAYRTVDQRDGVMCFRGGIIAGGTFYSDSGCRMAELLDCEADDVAFTSDDSGHANRLRRFFSASLQTVPRQKTVIAAPNGVALVSNSNAGEWTAGEVVAAGTQRWAFVVEDEQQHLYSTVAGGTCGTYTPQGYPFKITSGARAANVVTAVSKGAHGLRAGDTITLYKSNPSSFDGTFTIASAPDAITLTWAQAGVDEALNRSKVQALSTYDGATAGTGVLWVWQSPWYGGWTGAVVDGDLGETRLYGYDASTATPSGPLTITTTGAVSMPFDASVGRDLAATRDIAATRDVSVGRNLAVTGDATFTKAPIIPSFTVAGLPGGSSIRIAFASNGRKNGEGAGAGTGVLVFHDGTAWRACDTGATVAA